MVPYVPSYAARITGRYGTPGGYRRFMADATAAGRYYRSARRFAGQAYARFQGIGALRRSRARAMYQGGRQGKQSKTLTHARANFRVFKGGSFNKRKSKKLRSRVYQLEKRLKEDNVKVRERKFDTGVISSSANQTSYNFTSFICAHSTIDADTMRYYTIDPGTGTVTAVDEESARKTPYRISNFQKTIRLKNNNNVACFMTAYWCTAKRKSVDTPVSCVEEDLSNLGYSGTFQNDISLGLSGDRLKKDFIVKRKYIQLAPGEATQLVVKRKDFIWDQSLYTDDQNTYFPGDAFLIVRIHGDVAHDTTTRTLVGICESKLDWLMWIKYDYEAVNDHVDHLTVTNTTDTLADCEGVNAEDPNVIEDYDVAE